MIVRVACLLLVTMVSPIIAKPRVEISSGTALDKYVAAADPAFAWQLIDRLEQPTHVELIVKLTSQTWRDASEVSRTQWQHDLILVIPKNVRSDAAMLFISGGRNQSKAPTGAAELVKAAALSTQTVVVELRQVPNQPLRILQSDEPERDRVEDDLLAASWMRFMKTKDPNWLAQLPMAKSAVAAMDAVQQVLAKEKDLPQIKRFVVAGGSKRGWTTWLTAAVDDRVVAIAPIVIDVLNIQPSMKHHHASYGFWSEALQDYEQQGLADRLSTPESTEIRSIVDPYSYRERLTLPKCIINASGDEFFLPDSSRFYFDDLVGEKHLSYTPNAGHSLDGSNAIDTLLAFHSSVAYGLKRPTITWNGGDNSKGHSVKCSVKPTEAILWRAVNPKARDFRHPIVGNAYNSTPLEPSDDGIYRFNLETPERGFAATFARFTFDIGAAVPFRISTPVWISPDVEPFAE